jgi:hypothetical protein
MGAVAGLGLALSACGGSGSASSGAAPNASGLGSPFAAASGSSGSQGSAGTSATTSAGTNVGTSTGAGASAVPVVHASSVTLNWMPPTDNTNGSVLSNLSGYTIYYGPQSGDYTNSIKVDNPGLATYVVDNLAPGTYYFAVAAYNSRGTESPPSSEVSAIVE